MSLTQYYQVNVTVLTGYNINIDSVKFAMQRSGTGVRQFAVRSSVDGFANNLPASNGIDPQISIVPTDIFQTTDATNTKCSNNLLTTGFLNLTAGTLVSFRFYGWNAEGTGTFSIDDVIFYGSATTIPNTITTGAVTTPPFVLANCAATASGNVAFTSSSPFTGNTYTAQLSDAAGFFTSPVDIGTLVSDLNSGSIPVVIPAGTLSGAGYKIRIKSSSPVVIGTASTAFTITQSGTCGSLATDYFRSRLASGNWSTASSWESSPDNGVTPWITSTRVPDSAAKTITVLTGHNIIVAASLTGTSSVNEVVVSNGGTLTINSAITYNITNGAGTDLDVFGVVANAGTITNTGSAIVFEANSFYNHTNSTVTATAVPTATWNTTSTCIISGMTTAGPTAGTMSQSFGNVIWSCANQSAAYTINSSSFSCAGKLTIDTTGPTASLFPYFSIAGNGASGSTPYTNTIGALDVNGGVFNVISYVTAGTGTATATLFVSGDVNVNGGTLSVAAGTIAGGVATKTEVGKLFIGGNLSVAASPASLYSSYSAIPHNPSGSVLFNKAAGAQTINFSQPLGNIGYLNYYIGNSTGTYTTVRLLSDLPLRSKSAADNDSVYIFQGSGINLDTYVIYDIADSVYSAFHANNGTNITTANTNGLYGTGTAPANNGSIQVGVQRYATSNVSGLGINYTFNAATTTAFPTVTQVPGTRFFNPDTVVLNASITQNRAITVTHVLNLNTYILTQGGSNLTFSSITGTGSVSADSLSAITVILGGGISPVGTLRLTPGFQKT